MKINFVLAVLMIAITACNRNGDVVAPKEKPLIEAVYASGFVVAKDEYQVFAQADGTLADKLVNDGDEVKKNDILFIIESGQQSARFTLAKENYDLARRNAGTASPVLEELSAALASAKTKLQFDSTNFARYTNLYKQNATTRLEYDRYKLQYENSQHDFISLKSRLQKTRDQLQLELQNASSQLKIASDESGHYTVRSDFDGKVFKTLKEKGELIRRGELIAVVGRGENFYLQLSIDEVDIQRVKKGQQVMVKIDAYPNNVFHAVIDNVFPMVNQQQQSVRVDANFNEPLPGGFSGLAVEANIIIQQKEKALVVPKTALLEGDSVMVKNDSGKKKIKVVPGIQTLDEVEIVSGLNKNEKVVVQ